MNFRYFLLFLEDSSESADTVTKTPFEIACYVFAGLLLLFLVAYITCSVLDLVFRILYHKKMILIKDAMHQFRYDMERDEACDILDKAGIRKYSFTEYRVKLANRYSLTRVDTLTLVFSREGKLIDYSYSSKDTRKNG